MGKWKSRYGDVFVSLPSIIDDELEYEVLKLEKN